jgi:hypothetical protein
MQTAKVMSEMIEYMSGVGRTVFGCPKSSSNVDDLMHMYQVDTTLASYFKKRRDQSLDALMNVIEVPKLTSVIDETIRHKLKQSATLLNGKLYRLQIDTKAPGATPDITALSNKLNRDGRYTAKEVNDLIDGCKTDRAPAKSFTVISNG